VQSTGDALSRGRPSSVVLVGSSVSIPLRRQHSLVQEKDKDGGDRHKRLVLMEREYGSLSGQDDSYGPASPRTMAAFEGLFLDSLNSQRHRLAEELAEVQEIADCCK
jgi:hypothetical protein